MIELLITLEINSNTRGNKSMPRHMKGKRKIIDMTLSYYILPVYPPVYQNLHNLLKNNIMYKVGKVKRFS